MYYRITIVMADGRTQDHYSLCASMVDAFNIFINECPTFDGIYHTYIDDELAPIKYISLYPKPYPSALLESYGVRDVYKSHVTLDEIIVDGWSRDFFLEQTYSEVLHHGIPVSKDYILEEWDKLDNAYFDSLNDADLNDVESIIPLS